jgi:hypothetical protein
VRSQALGVVLLLGALACQSQREPAARSPSDEPAAKATHAGSAEAHPTESRSSERFGYEWKLPDGWRLVSATPPNWKDQATSPRDVISARLEPDGPLLMVVVTDYVQVIPGKHRGDDPQRFDKMERYGTQVLQMVGVKDVRTQRVRMFELDAVEVTGIKDGAQLSVRLLYQDRRQFEFRCIDEPQQAWRCDSALSSFKILPPAESESAPDVPRVRHLREERLGLAFDAPDDTWLSIGPRLGGGGAQSVWIWNKQGRQIDVQTMDLSSLRAKPTTAAFAAGMAEHERENGVTVKASDTTFAGQTWRHLEMSGGGKTDRDAFFVITDDVVYAILITHQTRDRSLIEAAKKGFRFIPRAR